MRIAFLGNFEAPYSSEIYHMWTLQEMGHLVTSLQEQKATGEEVWEAASQSDLFVWVHTHDWETPGMPMDDVLLLLQDKGVPAVTYHLDLWIGLAREKDMGASAYWQLDHFFTVDPDMAERLNRTKKPRGHFLPAGVYEGEAYRVKPSVAYPHDVVFVGSRGYHPEWPYRRQLVDWLQDTYGARFAHYGGDGRCAIRGPALNCLYASVPVVVGDTLCPGFSKPLYLSDRIFETTGRGGFMIHPYVPGMERFFELGKEVVVYSYGDFGELKEKIDYYLEHDGERERIRQAGFERTRRDHTYRKRWESILRAVFA
jgi:hypothetical protein